MTALTASIAASLIAQQGANVVIPEGYTSIANFAFSRKQLTSVSIPNSVTSIGDWAFEFSGLTSATIGNSVTSIGRNAFASNSLTNIIIPSSVTRIGNWAFEKNQLQSIAVPNSVASIGNNAFDRNQLTSATIGNSVTSIGSFAFENNQLTRVVIPSSVTSIGSNAFDAGVIRVYLGRNNGNGTPAAITSSTPTVFQEGVTLTAPAVTGDPDGDAGSPNYSYQWFKDGNAITGATTSTYAVPVSGAGTYKVAITYTDAQNFTATVDSANQVVTAINNGNGTPGVITSSTSGVFQEGVTLTAPAVTGDPDGDAGSPNYSYQWYKDSTLIASATAATYAVPVNGAGTYKVAITYTDAQSFTATVDSANQVVTAINNGNGTPSPPSNSDSSPEPSLPFPPISPQVPPEEETPERKDPTVKIPQKVEEVDPIIGQAIREVAKPGRSESFVFIDQPPTISRESADQITSFNPKSSVAALSQEVVPENRIFFKATRNQRETNRELRRRSNLIYNRRTGELIYDANGKEKGYGEGGGLLVIFTESPRLDKNNFVLIPADLFATTEGLVFGA